MNYVGKKRLLYGSFFLIAMVIIMTSVFFLFQWQELSEDLATSLTENNILGIPSQAIASQFILRNVLFAGTLAIISLFASPFLLYRLSHYRTTVLFFLCLYILTFSFDLARLWIAWTKVYPIERSLGYLLLRSIYFGRIFGVSCLFISSILALGMRAEKSGVHLLMMLLISMAIAYIMPIDTKEISAEFLYRTADDLPIDTIIAIIALISCVNYLVLAVRMSAPSAIPALAALLCLIIGKELTTYILPYITSIPLLSIMMGTTVIAGIVFILYQKKLLALYSTE